MTIRTRDEAYHFLREFIVKSPIAINHTTGEYLKLITDHVEKYDWSNRPFYEIEAIRFLGECNTPREGRFGTFTSREVAEKVALKLIDNGWQGFTIREVVGEPASPPDGTISSYENRIKALKGIISLFIALEDRNCYSREEDELLNRAKKALTNG